jgi:hypothetical protein
MQEQTRKQAYTYGRECTSPVIKNFYDYGMCGRTVGARDVGVDGGVLGWACSEE